MTKAWGGCRERTVLSGWRPRRERVREGVYPLTTETYLKSATEMKLFYDDFLVKSIYNLEATTATTN